MSISPSHLDALKALGYTEPEARFLYLVATHSGYFVARQFLGFTGAHWGKRTTMFWAKLHAQKHARTECFPKSGVIYHLFSRRLYRQIGRENLRNRREHEIEFIRQRIAMLDFVLSNQEYRYLETEPEKVRFFTERLKVPSHFLPAKTYQGSRDSQPTIRYFVDKFPMFLGVEFGPEHGCPLAPMSAGKSKELAGDKVAGMRSDEVQEIGLGFGITEGFQGIEMGWRDGHSERIPAVRS